MQDFYQTHGFAVEVNTGDPENGGNPTIIGFMVPKDRPHGSFDQRVNIVRVEFGHKDNDPNSLTFYKPDGDVLRRMALDDPDEGSDDAINKPMNLAWTGDEDSPLMGFVSTCIAKTCAMVCTASALKAHSGIPVGETIDAMVGSTPNMHGYAKADDGSLHRIGVPKEESDGQN
jgi:hypothetical protein